MPGGSLVLNEGSKTPFQNRKIRDQTKFEEKMRELKERRKVPCIIG